MTSLNDITISAEKIQGSKEEVIRLLNEYGVLIVPSFYPQERTARLDQEFAGLLEQKQPYIKNVPYSHGKAAYAMTKDMEQNLYPVTLETYNASFMDELTAMYF